MSTAERAVSRRERRSGVADRRLGRDSRWASIGLVLVLITASGFVLWSSQITGLAAERASSANRLSDNYDAAASALTEEQLLTLDYQEVTFTTHDQQKLTQASAAFHAALTAARDQAPARMRDDLRQIQSNHELYLNAGRALVSAVDRHDQIAVSFADSAVDQAFDQVDGAIAPIAVAQHQLALAHLEHLGRLESMNRRLTPVMFLVGLLLTILLTRVTQGHHRLLKVERAWAVHDSLHDELTGLPNRAYFADRAEQALKTSGQEGNSVGLLLIDLDRFKEINDTLGHHYGDAVLIEVAQRLSEAIRTQIDTVARLGGDEFAVLIPDMHTTADVLAVATRLTRALETRFRIEGVDLEVEASIGVVLSGEHGLDAPTLLKHADIAMYAAKAQSLDALIYNPAIDEHSPTRLTLLGDLRRAIENSELVLHYQPKISITSGDLVAVEALVRWQHPQRGLVPPGEFIPMAEHTGLIRPLTRHVLHTALNQARAWADTGQPVPIAVNLSARNLLDEQLPQQIAALLTAQGVAADLLVLEVTESAITIDPIRALRLLDDLSEMGIRISIDDFGTGYTSLAQLRHLPVNELKIDKTFVLTMIEDPTNAVIVRSVIDLGHNLGLSIVAEGIENQATLTALADLGCDIAQGYFISRPLDREQFDTWRRTHHPSIGETVP